MLYEPCTCVTAHRACSLLPWRQPKRASFFVPFSPSVHLCIHSKRHSAFVRVLHSIPFPSFHVHPSMSILWGLTHARTHCPTLPPFVIPGHPSVIFYISSLACHPWSVYLSVYIPVHISVYIYISMCPCLFPHPGLSVGLRGRFASTLACLALPCLAMPQLAMTLARGARDEGDDERGATITPTTCSALRCTSPANVEIQAVVKICIRNEY